jgi:hypothetical protein
MQKMLGSTFVKMAKNLSGNPGRMIWKHVGKAQEVQTPFVDAGMINTVFASLPQVSPNHFIQTLKNI